MSSTVISLDEFFEVIEESSLPISPDQPSFSLILGAGASRSAGIPLAGEMTALLAELIAARGYPLENIGPEGLTFSSAISTVVEYADDLFTPATVSAQIDTNDGIAEAPWAFDRSASVDGSREQQRAALGITALHQSVMPLLDAIDKWDDELLSYDCLPGLQEQSAHAAEVYWDGREAKEVEALGKAVTRRLPWTRRNRKLLRLALDESTDPLMSHTLLTTIDTIRAPRQPKSTRPAAQ